MPLSDAEIQALPAKATPYKHAIGEGLYVYIQPNGKKYWRIKYRLGRREQTYSVGVFPRISVAEAIEARQHLKDLVYAGIHPGEAKREAKKLHAESIPKRLFHLSLAPHGELTIETSKKLLILTPPETDALRSFLAVNQNHERNDHVTH